VSNTGLSPQAREQVEAFLHEMATHYGNSPKSMHQFFQDMEWAASQRRAITRMGSWAAKSVMTAVAGGFMIALWEGFKHLAGR